MGFRYFICVHRLVAMPYAARLLVVKLQPDVFSEDVPDASSASEFTLGHRVSDTRHDRYVLLDSLRRGEQENRRFGLPHVHRPRRLERKTGRLYKLVIRRYRTSFIADYIGSL